MFPWKEWGKRTFFLTSWKTKPLEAELLIFKNGKIKTKEGAKKQVS